MPSVLFVCTANRFRSPLAAACFQRRLQRESDAQDWSVGSAGTWAEPDQAVIPSAKWMADHLSLDLNAHRSRPVRRELLGSYDLILVMENSHREGLLVEFPEIKSRLFLLSEVAAGQLYNIPDPSVQPGDTFQDIAMELRDLIENGVENICHLARRLHEDKVG